MGRMTILFAILAIVFSASGFAGASKYDTASVACEWNSGMGRYEVQDWQVRNAIYEHCQNKGFVLAHLGWVDDCIKDAVTLGFTQSATIHFTCESPLHD
jgi:hypothetical protein